MSPVVFSELKTKNNKKIAIAELNAPKALNALSLVMFELLLEQLLIWQSNDEIAMVILQGAGGKAFCAGGDVVSLYHQLQSQRNKPECLTTDGVISDHSIANSFGQAFFSKEYQVDQLIHEFTKPILVWGDGYIMGGGIGLFAGASHKVVTEKSLLAMPEITIGLYPDVGASWFLNKMPNNIGLFLGLTGAIFNAADALEIGLANTAIASKFKNDLMESLTVVEWQSGQENYQLLDHALACFSRESSALLNALTSNITKHQDVIAKVTDFDNAADIYHAILALETAEDWVVKAQAKLKKGSPLSAMVIYQQLSQSKSFTLAQCFASEYNLSLRFCQHQEFSEGVRALLVDKDKKSRWAFDDIKDIPVELVNWFFTPITHLEK